MRPSTWCWTSSENISASLSPPVWANIGLNVSAEELILEERKYKDRMIVISLSCNASIMMFYLRKL